MLASPSLYRLSHADIRDRLAPLLNLPGLKLEDKRLCLEALDIFAEHAQLDFADALTIAHMRESAMTEIYSYDRDFDHLPGITRREP